MNPNPAIFVPINVGGELHLFSDAGVEIIGDHHPRPDFTWCFVDFAHAVPLHIKLYKLFPVYVTSPKRSRWEKLYQQRHPELVIMNPWTKAELEKAWVMVHFTHADSCKERYSFRAERVKTFPKGSTMRDQVHASAWNIHLWKLVICTPNGMR